MREKLKSIIMALILIAIIFGGGLWLRSCIIEKGGQDALRQIQEGL